MVAAKKKLTPSVKKATATVLTSPSKRPRPEAEMAGYAPQPKKRVKKLAKKGEREIQVISSHTTGSIAPNISLPPPIVEALKRGLQNPPKDQATKVHPTISAVVESIVAPLVKDPVTPGLAVTLGVGPVAVDVGKTTTLAKKNRLQNPKKRSIIIVE